jgi:hypothetical protein
LLLLVLVLVLGARHDPPKWFEFEDARAQTVSPRMPLRISTPDI